MAVNVQTTVEAQVFGVNLMGMVERKEDKEKNQITTEFLIMPSTLYENEPITVEKIVKEINRTIYKIRNNKSDEDISDETKISNEVNELDVEKALDVIGLKNAQLTFTQVFVHYKKISKNIKKAEVINKTKNTIDTENAGSAVDTNDTTDKNPFFEFAVGIYIKADKIKAEDFKFLQIHEAYIKVWDTNNQKVLERMQILIPEQLGIELEG